MKNLAIILASVFLLTACAGGPTWTRQAGKSMSPAGLSEDTSTCKTLAVKEAPSVRYGKGPYSKRVGSHGYYSQKRNVVFEACMGEKGWTKTENPESS